MANRIKGITVEIGGDTTGLDKALKGINNNIRKTQSSLRDVNRLLKLDPKNTTLLSQKQKLLKDSISQTKEKLDGLKEAQKQAKEQLERGELGQDKYDALQREIVETENELKRLEQEAKGWTADTAGASGSRTYTETASTIASGSHTRWFRVRARGPAGASEWRYAHRVYSAPNAPSNVKGEVAKQAGGMQTKVTWSITKNTSYPVDSTVAEYPVAFYEYGWHLINSNPDGVVWDTDYVMNFDEMQLAVRLDRSYLESALTVDPKFSTPHFISLLIEHDYIKDDGDLPVSNRPVVVEDSDIEMLARVINGESKYRLPVVYVSKTFYGEDPVNIKWMSSRLKGIAHVLVQKGGWQNSEIRQLCDNKNEYYGAIGIYYPNQAMGHRRFLYRAYDGSDDILMEKVIRSVINYSNSQMLDMLYTWSGVNNALLRDRYSSQKEERLAAEFEKAKAVDEADQLIESVDEELRRLQKQVDQLTKANDALIYENQGLRAKLDSSEDIPILFLGDEDEFFQGEIREMILDALTEKMKNTQSKTRRHDVLNDIIQKNGYEGVFDKKAAEVKSTLRDYKNMSGTTKQFLIDLGFVITEEGKHYRLTYYGDGRYKTTVAKSGSDHREGKNIAATIIKNML